jgi:hypothetical protein
MSKQTAVEWLEMKFAKTVSASDWFEKAKQMEREQIEQAYGDGLNAHRTNFCNRQQYYNETFNNISEKGLKDDV